MNKFQSNFIKALEEIKLKKKEKLERQRNCKHEWKSRYDFVYDYDHQDCVKCGAWRMV